MGNRTISDELEETAANLHHKVERDLVGALGQIQDNGDRSPVHHLYVALVAAAGAIETAARIMSIPSSPTSDFYKWSQEPVDRHAILAAAIMLARSLVPNKGGFVFQYSPQNIKLALDATQKLTGNADTSMFTQKMVESVSDHRLPAHIFDNSGVGGDIEDTIRTLH